LFTKLIVCEDELLTRNTIVKMIEKNCPEYTVVGAFSNGDEAISYLEQSSVDVVLTDIRMPTVCGIELCEYIDHHCSETKTIVLSGYGEFEYAKKCIEYGVTAYLLKPVDFHELFQLLSDLRKDFLENKRGREQERENRICTFFTDLSMGWISSADEIYNRYREIDSAHVPSQVKGFLLKIHMPAPPQIQADELFCSLQGVPPHTLLLPVRSGNTILYCAALSEQYRYTDFTVLAQAFKQQQEHWTRVENIGYFSKLTELSGKRWLINDQEEVPSTQTDSLIEKAKEYVKKYYDRDISRDLVAEAMFISPTYFSRIFKQQTNMTFSDYVTKIKMEKAIEMLKERKTVLEICKKIGYHSKKNFYYNFKRYTCCSPTEYMRNVLGFHNIPEESEEEELDFL